MTQDETVPSLEAPCGWCGAMAGYRPRRRPYLVACMTCGEESYLPTRADLDRIDALMDEDAAT